MAHEPIDIAAKFATFTERWSPRIIAQMNDYHVKIVRLQGEFVWHSHAETDEVFIVVDGAMTIRFRDGAVDLRAGQMFVVPRGVEHQPTAAAECKLMLVEPLGTLNTGDQATDRTATPGVWA